MTVLSSKIARDHPIKKQNSGNEESSNQVASVHAIEQWEAFRSGSETAFSNIYQDFTHELYGYGMNIFPHREMVMDAIQDLFIKLWSSRENLSEVRSVRAYLYTSLRRRVIAKSTEHRKLILVEEDKYFMKIHVDSSEQQYIDREQERSQQAGLDEALSQLSAKQREIIFLRFYQKLSYEEIAQIVGSDKKAAYNLMARTLDRLKKLMGGLMTVQIIYLLNNL